MKLYFDKRLKDPTYYAQQGIRNGKKQQKHITPGNLITTLKNMNVTNIHDIEYMALYHGSKVLDDLCEISSLNLDRKHYRPKDIHATIKKLLK